MIKDKSGQSDHTLVFKTAGKNVLFYRCPIEGSQACTPIGNASGYSLKKMTFLAKKAFYGATAEKYVTGACVVLVLLVLGGFTLFAAAMAVTSLAAGAIGTAAVSGLIAVLVGGNLVLTRQHAPATVAELKHSQEVSMTLKNGVESQADHVITVSDLKQFENYLVSVLPQ
jgi:hypothetical protein